MGKLFKGLSEGLKHLFHPLYKEFCGKITREEADDIMEVVNQNFERDIQKQEARKEESLKGRSAKENTCAEEA